MSKSVQSNASINKKKEFPVFTVFIIVIAILLAAFITYNTMKNNGYFLRKQTVLEIEDTKISAMDFQYIYSSTLNSYSSILSYLGITSSSDLDKTCSFDSSMTWKQYFASSAYDSLVSELQIYTEGVKAGITLDDKDNENLQEQIDTIKSYADKQNMSVKEYLSRVYRQGFTIDDISKMIKIGLISSKQQDAVKATYKYTDDEVEKYYSENKTSFDKYTYRVMNFSVSDTVKAEDAKANAQAFLDKVTDEDSFVSAVNATDGTDGSQTLKKDVDYSTITSDLQSWISSDERKEADTTLITDEKGNCYVVYFIKDTRPDYNGVSMRLMTYAAKYDKDATSDEKTEAVNTAKNEVQSYIDKWVEDGKTEDGFASLVKDHSSDSDTAADGGLVSDFSNTYYDTAVSDWAFDSNRKSGDYTVLTVGETVYALYFVSENGDYLTTAVKNTMTSKDLQDYIKSLSDTYSDKISVNNKDQAVKSITG